MSRPQISNHKELSALLCRLFSVAELRRHIRLDPQLHTLHSELPEGDLSMAQMASDVTALADRHGIVEALFEMLRAARPSQGKEIEGVRALFQPSLYELNTQNPSRSDTYGKWFSMRLRLGPLKVVIALSVFIAALGVTAQVLSIGIVPEIQVLRFLSHRSATNGSPDLFSRYYIPWVVPLPKETGRGVDMSTADVSAEWCGAVVEPVRKTVAGRYPFSRRSTDDVEIGAFGLLFHPEDGAIAQFRDQHLSEFLERWGDRVVARERDSSASLHLDKRAVNFFDSALRLGLIVYSGREFGFDLEMSFACSEKHVSRVSIIVNGTTYWDRCYGDARRLIRWPGNASREGVVLETTGIDKKGKRIEKAGAFGLLRLFESGRWQQRVRNEFSVAFDSPAGSIGMNVRLPSFPWGSVEASDAAQLSVLAPFRRNGLTDPPQALFVEYPYSCANHTQ